MRNGILNFSLFYKKTFKAYYFVFWILTEINWGEDLKSRELFLFRVLLTTAKTPKIPKRKIRKNKRDILVDLFIKTILLSNLRGNNERIRILKLRKH